MSRSKLIIELIYEEMCLAHFGADRIQDPVLIGRAADCAGRIPATDKTASAHHARILRRGRHIVIEDTGSRNGISVNGKKVSEVRLTAGTRVSIGKSELRVEEKREEARTAHAKWHQLEFALGPNKGETIPITKSPFTIGAAEGNDLVLTEPLISQEHVKLRLDEAGSCWISDSNSTNGSAVNQDLLVSGKERLLQNGDVISIACVDLRFLDRNVRHTRSYVGLKIFAAFITLVLVVATYVIYLSAGPGADEMIRTARAFAGRRNLNRLGNCWMMSSRRGTM